jgi:hypothetical protein
LKHSDFFNFPFTQNNKLVTSSINTSSQPPRLSDFGTEYLLFFQDTNPLAFRAAAALLGVSAEKGLAMNSLAVGRKAKEAAGAIMGLKKKPDAPAGGTLPDSMVINVEYCHLGGLLVGGTHHNYFSSYLILYPRTALQIHP